jgi:hypothetical protein
MISIGLDALELKVERRIQTFTTGGNKFNGALSCFKLLLIEKR